MVRDVNEAPVVQTLSIEASERTDATPLEAGDAVGAPIVATDPEGGQVRFAVTSLSSSGESLFTIDATTGQLRVTAAGAAAMDFETSPTLQATVTASDSGTPPQSVSQSIVVRVRDANEAPTFGFFAILSGNQQGLWSMDAVGGDIRFAQSNPRALDFESAPRQSTLVVSVTDNGAPDGLKRSSTATLQMIVLDVNEPPAVVLPVAGLEVCENSAPGASAGSVSCADVDASDQSGLALALVAQEAIPGTSGVLPFVIDAGTGVLRVSPGAGGALLDAESKATYELQLQCTDNLGLVSETKSASVRIVDVNEAPVCAGPLSFSAAKGVKAMVGTPLGAVCSDPDSGDTLVFAIHPSSQAAAPAFAVDATSGQLRVHDVSGTGAGSVNDASARFALNVTVADKQGLATVVHVLVRMTDTNDPPVFGASVPRMLSVPESSTDGFIVALLQATDEDFASDQSHRLTYSLAPTGRSVNRPFPFAVTTTQDRRPWELVRLYSGCRAPGWLP
ncbi:hypothetical protein FNF27_08085 [Cafeteria roenbergensis]|uniref:Cadherin domain-containing protein n=1 Tax=Cafeteria roenbergensis TaxID=33653 RepID=A0A5A8DE69_CAFRO|nr:hypothetical protein FNF27_08085 [Cafeteria roenbergensis]